MASFDASRLILGVETSCDETAAAVVEGGNRILSSVVASQVDVHHPYGGVVPELAARKHIEAIFPTVHGAIERAGISPEDLYGVAATRGPGLIGALLVGFSFAKSYAYARNLPFIGVNHLEGHIGSVFLSDDPPDFPFAALLASGGHTGIYKVSGHTQFQLLGQTRDDAAGEAYDKVAKMLGLGYPGGRIIDELARKGDPEKIRFPRIYLDREKFDFSFSGLKTAVGRYIGANEKDLEDQIPDIAAGFQEAVVDVLTEKILLGAQKSGCRHLAIVGGVAANGRLRERVTEAARKQGIGVHIPPISLCGDNAAMIAGAGYHRLEKGERDSLASDVYSRAM